MGKHRGKSMTAPLRALVALALCVGLCPAPALAAGNGHAAAAFTADGEQLAAAVSAADSAAESAAGSIAEPTTDSAAQPAAEPTAQPPEGENAIADSLAESGLVTATAANDLGYGRTDSFELAGDTSAFSVSRSREQLGYSIIADAYRNGETTVDVSQYKFTIDETLAAISLVQDDPEFYYADGSVRYSFNPSTQIVYSLKLSYLFDTAQLDEAKATFEQKAAAALSWVSSSMSDLYKVQALHDFLVRTVEYDRVAASRNAYSTAHTAYGALVDQMAVCQGYAMAYKLLLTRLGIPCVYVASEDMNHGWNMVKLDGNWYHVDCTWDDPLPDGGFSASVSHTQFLRSDVSMVSLGYHGWKAQHAASADYPTYDMPVFNGPATPEPGPTPPGPDTPASIDRLAGEEAADTSAQIAQAGFANGSEWVVIARDDDFADAMSATGLAGTLGAPILLTSRYGLSDAAERAVRALGATKAYVIGGKGAIPGNLEDELDSVGCTEVKRVFGEESWDTSVACAEKIAEHGGNPNGDAIVAMSSNFQDALSISSFAYKYKVPIYLETSGGTRKLPSEARKAIKKLRGTVYVPGGPGAVPTDSVEGVFGESRVQRIYGEDGYDTSNQIATYMVGHGLLSASTVCVASGAPDPKGVDALAGAALAGRARGVMLLANDNAKFGDVDFTTVDGPDSTGAPAFLASHAADVRQAHLLGGNAVVGANLQQKVESLLG